MDYCIKIRKMCFRKQIYCYLFIIQDDFVMNKYILEKQDTTTVK